MQRFRGWLVFNAHRLLYHSTLGWRVIKKKKKDGAPDVFIVYHRSRASNEVLKDALPSPASLGLTGYSQVDILGLRYKPVFAAGKSPGHSADYQPLFKSQLAPRKNIRSSLVHI